MANKIVQDIATLCVGAAVLIGGVLTFDNFFGGTPMTPEEWQAYVKMIDYEAKQKGGIVIEGARGREDLINKLNDEILARPVDEKVILGDEALTKDEYEALRAGLIDKFEKSKDSL